MNQKERMLNGLPYKAWLDGLEEEREICKELVYELNFLPPKERRRIPGLLKKLFGKTGENVWIEPPFHCDYGWNIEVGNNFFAKYLAVVSNQLQHILWPNRYFPTTPAMTTNALSPICFLPWLKKFSAL